VAGRFITVEGVDGSGKSTQITMLKDYLQKEGYDIVVTHEPGGTEIGEQIRKIILDSAYTQMTALTEVFLYAAARAQHIEEIILPALKSGRLVLCSRFFDSTVAYQGYGGGLDLAVLADINRIVSGSLVPDLTIIFDLDPEKGLERVSMRNISADEQNENKDRMEQKQLDFHKRVRDGFLALASQNPQRIRIVDAIGNKDEVFERTRKVIDDFILRSVRKEGAK
jgi:dTMP kinase